MNYKYTWKDFYTFVLKRKCIPEAAKSNKKYDFKLNQWTKTDKLKILIFYYS
jgi:hypothetical protein